MLEAYKNRFGAVVNTDLARRMFADVGYNGQNSAAVQEAASALGKDAWRDALKTNPEKDAFIFSGGSGVGKSSIVDKFLPEIHNDAAAVLDGNLSSVGSAEKRIKEAIAAGKTPHIVYVYRDPVDAWVNGVVKRMKDNQAEGGRIVPMSVFLENHPGSLKVIKKLISDNSNAVFHLFDNSLGAGNGIEMTVDKLNELGYNVEKLKTRLMAETKRLLKENVITKEQYAKLIE